MYIIQTQFVPRTIVRLLSCFSNRESIIRVDRGWMAERLSRLITNVEGEVQGQRQDCVWPTLYRKGRSIYTGCYMDSRP